MLFTLEPIMFADNVKLYLEANSIMDNLLYILLSIGLIRVWAKPSKTKKQRRRLMNFKKIAKTACYLVLTAVVPHPET